MANVLARLSDDELRWLIRIVLEHEQQTGGVISPEQLRAIFLGR